MMLVRTYTTRSGQPAVAGRLSYKLNWMNEEEPPRRLAERTGRHVCICCLKEILPAEYFQGDFACRDCAARVETYPLASTPAQPEERGAKSEER